MFINLSNHPSVGWGEAQLAEASAYGEVIDLPFPDIRPEDGPDVIAELADRMVLCVRELAAVRCAAGPSSDRGTDGLELPEAETLTVHVMGEMTFTYAVVSRLKDLGIPCVASTTERAVTELPDGRKVSEFRFVRFRRY